MKTRKGKAFDEELVKRLDANMSGQKEAKKHNCTNKPGMSCNCQEDKKEDELKNVFTRPTFERIVRYYLTHDENPLDVVFYDLNKAYDGYLDPNKPFHAVINGVVTKYCDMALNNSANGCGIMAIGIAKSGAEADDVKIEKLAKAVSCGIKKCGKEKEEETCGVERVFDECLELYKKKNHDYSNHGESAFDKAYKKMGAKSLWLRLNDKFTRFESLLFAEDEAQVKDEKIEDTLLDLINYAAMGLAKLKGYDK